MGDILVVELINKIPHVIDEEVQGKLPKEVVEDLHEIGSVRPNLMVPVWIAYSMERHGVDAATRQKVDRAWRRLLDDFLVSSEEVDGPYPFEKIDLIQAAAKTLKVFSLRNLNTATPYVIKFQELLKSIQGGSELGFEKCALQEANTQAPQARFVVYGHTHEFKMVPLRSAQTKQSTFDLIYFNSGTWHPLHEKGLDDHPIGFVAYKTMSYLGFFKGDERKGRAYETWSGALDL